MIMEIMRIGSVLTMDEIWRNGLDVKLRLWTVMGKLMKKFILEQVIPTIILEIIVFVWYLIKC